MDKFDEFHLDGYDLAGALFLAEGSYGKVYKVRSLKRNDFVALKQINMDKIKQEHLEELLKREITLMKELRSPHTIELIEDQLGDNYTYMALELCDGDLRNQMEKSKTRFPEAQCIEIFGEIIQGFEVMVKNSCIHRDIKPANILLKDNHYKIADFGFACKADLLGAEKMMEICGTPIYMAPQLLFNQPYTAKCDIWSLGLMLYELIYGATPWPVRCIENYKKSLEKRHLAFPFDIKIGKETKDFLKRALVVDENKRMSWEELFNHPLVKDKVTGEAVKVLEVTPKVRRVLSMMQREAERKSVNQVGIFKELKNKDGLNFNEFSELLKKLNPTVTTYEIKLLFETCDTNKNERVDEKEFFELFCENNFRRDVELERELDEIVGIVVAKEVQLGELFDQFDSNHTKALDFNEFKRMILTLAPKYSNTQINKLYKQVDIRSTGLISKEDLFKTIGKGLVNQNCYSGLWAERAERNLKDLKIHIQSKGMSSEDVMKTGDLNVDSHLDLGEFLGLMKAIEFSIMEEEAKEIFKLIDRNGSEKVSVLELTQFLN